LKPCWPHWSMAASRILEMAVRSLAERMFSTLNTRLADGQESTPSRIRKDAFRRRQTQKAMKRGQRVAICVPSFAGAQLGVRKSVAGGGEQAVAEPERYFAKLAAIRCVR
jgi:hypothetical protein